MRLIDADKLCEEFKRRQKAALNWKEKAIMNDDLEIEIRADAVLGFLSEVKLTIDKAPTVNDCPICEYKINYDYITSSSSYKELQALRKFKKDNERLTGKWIKETSGYYCYFRCNKCNSYCTAQKTNYCPNCGAKMKGAEE